MPLVDLVLFRFQQAIVAGNARGANEPWIVKHAMFVLINYDATELHCHQTWKALLRVCCAVAGEHAASVALIRCLVRHLQPIQFNPSHLQTKMESRAPVCW